MNDKILPCPFCGSSDTEYLDIASGPNCSDDPEFPQYGWTVLCNGCGAQGPTKDGGMSRAVAQEAWNDRAGTDVQALRRWVRELEDCVFQQVIEIQKLQRQLPDVSDAG